MCVSRSQTGPIYPSGRPPGRTHKCTKYVFRKIESLLGHIRRTCEPNLGVLELFVGTDPLFADLVVPTLGSIGPGEMASHAH